MAKDKVHYECQNCSYQAPSFLGRCPECQQWNTFQEVVERKAQKNNAFLNAVPGMGQDYMSFAASSFPPESSVKMGGSARGGNTGASPTSKSVSLTDVDWNQGHRYSSGYEELDRVLGGGWIAGSYILLGGDPGIGKSTLMLQVAHKVAQQEKSVLYVAGEESPHQVKQRAERLGVAGEKIRVLPEIEIHRVVEEIVALRPQLVIIDSIQSMVDGNLSNPPGSVTQIKNCAALLMGVSKSLNVTIVLIGHVTKEGAFSGPKLLEHMVDAVLYFEGEKYKDLRILRTMKNRFGSTQEIGVFEMAPQGLVEVSNPSELFLSGYGELQQPGSVVICTVEGSRPLLVEIQALVGYSSYATPRRVATGLESNRLHQVVAVLERRLGLNFAHQDLYVNVVGGIHVEETAADLGMALALMTSLRNVSVLPGTVVVGEIGLTGEVRPVRRWKDRVAEAEKIGFKRIILPSTSDDVVKRMPIDNRGIEVIGVRTIMDTVAACVAPLPGGEPVDFSEYAVRPAVQNDSSPRSERFRSPSSMRRPLPEGGMDDFIYDDDPFSKELFQ